MEQHQLQRLRQQQRQQTTVFEAAAQPIIPIDLELNKDHAAAMEITEKHASEVKTIRDHNRRISIMISWIKNNYPEYHSVMVNGTPHVVCYLHSHKARILCT